jgi:hypothetical protein
MEIVEVTQHKKASIHIKNYNDSAAIPPEIIQKLTNK